MAKLDRREFLRFGAMSVPFALFSSRLAALAPSVPGEKLLVIFARGGNDPLNTLPPHGDPGYKLYRTTAARNGLGGSDIYIEPSTSTAAVKSIPLHGTSYVEAHPNLAPLATLLADGRAAFLGRVGNTAGTRSHFTSFAQLEHGDPNNKSRATEGWCARLAQTSSITTMKAASHTDRGQQLLLSTTSGTIIPVIPDLYDQNNMEQFLYEVANPVTPALQLIEGRTTAPTTAGLRSHVSSQLVNTTPEARYAQESGRAFFDVRDELKALAGFSHSAALFPRTQQEATNAGLPGSPEGLTFMDRMEEAMFVLKNTSSFIAGLDLGSFDTHTNQLNLQGTLLAYLAYALASADALARADDANNYLFLVITDFGRTIKSNATGGCDHGIATTYFAVGDKVRGRIFNMSDPSSPPPPGTGQNWKLLSQSFPAANPNHTNAVVPATDPRAIVAEVAHVKFKLPLPQVDTVLGHTFTPLIGGDDTLYHLLGYLEP